MKKVLDLTGEEPEIIEIDDCEYCGAELSHCDCEEDEYQSVRYRENRPPNLVKR